MTLTKKHFIRVAEIIEKGIRKGVIIDGKREWKINPDTLCSDLANYFAEENPLFDRQKFLEACGVK